jgi:uncharacterized protein (DUF885 family)/Tol biopolymer transport system component
VIKLWDLESGRAEHTLVGHTDNVVSLAFSPDGALLASAGRDGRLQVWRMATRQPIYSFEGLADPAYALAFSPDGRLLAFSGDNGEIQLLDLTTGEEVQRLRGHQESVFALAFSPDGSLLASGGLDETVVVWGIPAPGARTAQRAPATGPDAAGLPGGTALAPAGNGVIAFSSYRDGESAIFSMKADGTEITHLSRGGLRDTRPAWSPDGSRIAYARRIGHANHEIYVMNADGSGAKRLTDLPQSTETEPAWSPDGSRLAYISNQSLNANTFTGRFNVFVMEADGSEPTLLTDMGGSNTSPDWSPEGGRIAFDSTRDGNHEIYAMRADGSCPVNLTQHPAHDTSPAWSPDGTRIAFVSDRDGNQEIYVMEADGSNPRRLTYARGFDKAPSWSPDGEHIVFYANREAHNTEVYLMRADGSHQVRLTDHADFDGFPDWQPLLPESTAAPGDEVPIREQVAVLEGLPLDEFFEASFALLMQRDPEWVTAEGLAEHLGTDNERLTDLSDAYVQETQWLQATILDLLRQFDRGALNPEQQISYDVYEWWLDDLVRGQPFTYHDYPVTHFLTGVQYQLIELFENLHPMDSRQDAEAYVARLWQVDEKFEGLREGLRLRAERGVIVPRRILSWLMGDIGGIARSQARFTPFYRAFEEKLRALDEVDSGEQRALLEEAEAAIEASVIPAFAALEETLLDLQGDAPAEAGVWQLSRGDEYYQYVLRHHTTSDLTADEIHELGLQELERIQGEMRAAFQELGYPAEESIPELYARLQRESGTVWGAEVAETYEGIIGEAEENLDAAFGIRPEAEVVVIAGPQGDYYVSASLDGSRPGAFYARTSGGGKERYGMRTLAYHEAVPGHHFQIAIAQEQDLPLFRNVLVFTGYAEGWALYAEDLAYELGWYEGDAYGNLGRLQDQAFRAARLVVDTGLHEGQWSFEEAHEFMVENVGRDPGYLAFEVTRYMAWPGQATAYMVGMLRIQELRQQAMDRLGKRFDLKEFHDVVLGNGSMPLEVLERVLDDYVEAKLAE